MGSPELGSTSSFRFGQEQLRSLLELAEVVETETKLPKSRRPAIELNTNYIMRPPQEDDDTWVQTISRLELRSYPDTYELELFTQEVEAKDEAYLAYRDYMRDERLRTWRDTRLTIPKKETQDPIRAEEMIYTKDMGDPDVPTEQTHLLAAQNAHDAAWLHAISQRTLGAIRQKLSLYPRLTTTHLSFEKTVDFVAQNFIPRLEETLTTAPRPAMSLLPYLIGAHHEPTILFPRICIRNEVVSAVRPTELSIMQEILYVEPDMLGMESYPSIPLSTPAPEQGAILVDMQRGLPQSLKEKEEIRDKAREIIYSYRKHAGEMYPNDLSILGDNRTLHLFSDVINPEEPDELTIQVEEMRRILFEDAYVLYSASSPWAISTPTHKTATLLLGLFHDIHLASDTV